MEYLINDGPTFAKCPYCDKQIKGEIIEGMHPKCHEDFMCDLDQYMHEVLHRVQTEVFGDEGLDTDN